MYRYLLNNGESGRCLLYAYMAKLKALFAIRFLLQFPPHSYTVASQKRVLRYLLNL